MHLPAHERNKFTTQSIKCAFLGYAITQKGYVCYDPQSRCIRISRNVVFFEDQYFFPSFIDPPFSSLSSIPHFSNSSTIVERFKPGFVYKRRCLADPGFLHDSASALDPVTLVIPLRWSTRPSKPPDWYGFYTPISLLATCLLFAFLLITHRLWNMNVGNKQCKKKYKHFKRITLGTLFLALPWSNLLEVNGFSLSSFVLMALWTVIKLD